MQYAEKIAAKGAPLANCCLFIDGTVRQMCRPKRLQKEAFNGHKRHHGLKFQSLVAPNDLIVNLHGLMSGRRHDAALLSESKLLDFMQRHGNTPNGEPLIVYGDPAYPLTRNLSRPYRGQHLTAAEAAFNKWMSSVRQCVEWEFGKVAKTWAFLDFHKNLRLFSSPVGKFYMVGVLINNCHTCLYGSETSQYFGLNPPTLEEYLY